MQSEIETETDAMHLGDRVHRAYQIIFPDANPDRAAQILEQADSPLYRDIGYYHNTSYGGRNPEEERWNAAKAALRTNQAQIFFLDPDFERVEITPNQARQLLTPDNIRARIAQLTEERNSTRVRSVRDGLYVRILGEENLMRFVERGYKELKTYPLGGS